MSVPSASLRPYVRQAGEHQRLAYTRGAELAVILDAAITGWDLSRPMPEGWEPAEPGTGAATSGPRRTPGDASALAA